MNITEAKEALIRACESLVSEANEKGLIADYRCFAANVDLEEVDDSSSSATLIASEITLGADSTEQKMVLECAVSINEGTVADDEVLREVSSLRENIKDFYVKLAEAGTPAEAFKSIAEENEEPVPEVKTYDNKKFYIGATIVAVIAIILIIVSRSL